MTAVDLAILGVIGYAFFIFASVGRNIVTAKTRTGLATIILGLCLTALFYLADLMAMHALPLFMPMAEAMGIMRDLHLNYRWPVTLLGVGCVVFGLATVSRGVSSLFEKLLKTERDVRAELTVRKKSEQALQESQFHLTKAQLLAKIGHWRWSIEADELEYCSEEFARIHGVTMGDIKVLMQEQMSRVIHPDDRERVAERFRAFDKDGLDYEIDYQIVRPDGEVRHVLELGEAVLDSTGRAIAHVGTIQDITERKRAEDVLRQGEASLAQAQRIAGLGSFEWDIGTDELRWSDHNYRLFGFEPQAFPASNDVFMASVHPGDRDHVTRSVDQAVHEGKPYDFEYRIVRPNGEVRYLRDQGELILGEDGKPAHLNGTTLDFTDRKKAEETLKVREAQLRQAQQMARIGVFIWDDVEDRCLYCSEELASLLGISVEVFMATRASRQSILPWIHDEDRARYDAVVTRALDEAASYDVNYRVYDAAGNLWHLREQGEPELDAEGRQVRTFGTVQDITAIRKTEDELRESERRYRELFDESPVAIWEEDWSSIKQMLDDLAQGGVQDWCRYFNSHRDQLRTAYDLAKITEVSRTTVEIYGAADKEELASWSVTEFVTDEELDAFCEVVLSFLAGQMTVETESRDTAFHKPEIIVRRRVVIPPKYRDDWSRVIYAIEDVTERARVEEQLRQAQKMEAVGQLTGGVAHDFNNLLAVIMGNAEVLAARLGDDDKPAQAVIRAAIRGAELIERLLSFSRSQPLSPQSINIDAVITEMTYMLHRTLGETVEIEIRIAPDLWPALADSNQLGNAVLNLAINARDAMPNGGKLIIESANAPLDESYTASHSEVRPGDYVMLAVSDTGTGMSRAVLKHAFEPFFTTKEVGAGSGLGLSMVYGFAKQSGGEVAIDTEEGRGTTVRLYLPRAEAATDNPERKTSAKELIGRGETILVVEDDPDVRALAEVVLENLRYRVLTAEDGRTGLAALEKAPGVDLLLSDVVLPGGMSGPDLAEQVWRQSPDLKVLFMSGYVDTAIQHHSPLPKNSELLKKPFRKNELARKVRAVLDR